MQLQEKPIGSQSGAIWPEECGIYVHVPFCSTSCDFCGFYREPLNKGAMRRYIDGMCRSFSSFEPELDVSTVFWGGGTPGLLPPEMLAELGRSMLAAMAHPPREWTVEMAPATVNPSRLKVLREIGVTRLSIGVQSFDSGLLEKLGRDHSPVQVVRAIEMARREGFDNINLDLMFALPGQSSALWEEDMRQAVALAPEHISAYCLTFEEDTALWARLQRGATEKRSLADEADYYLATWDYLESRGYAQYEISNFARDGHACIHNLNTWKMGEWLGFGPAAASQWKGRRWRNIPSLDEWFAGVMAGAERIDDEVDLSAAMLAEDYLVFGLRTNSGVDLDLMDRRFPDWEGFMKLQGLFRELESEGFLLRVDSVLRLTREGRLLADGIGSRILEAL